MKSSKPNNKASKQLNPKLTHEGSGKIRKDMRPKSQLSRSVLLSLGLAFVVVVTAVLYSVYVSRQQVELAEGKPSPQLFKSEENIEVIDPIATERLRQQEREKVEDVYRANAEATAVVRDAVDDWEFSLLIKAKVLEFYAAANGVNQAQRDSLIEQALNMQRLQMVEATSSEQRELLNTLRRTLENDLLVTSEVDGTLTQILRDTAAEAVTPVYRELQAGETIVREGAILSAEHLRVLEAVGLYNPRSRTLLNIILTLCAALLMALLMSGVLLYNFLWLPKALYGRQIIFLLALTALQLVIQRLLFLLDTGFLVTSLVPLVLVVIVHERAAIILAVWLSLLTAMFVPEAAMLTVLVSLASSVGAVTSLRWFQHRSSLLFAGSVGGAAAIIMLLLYSFLVTSVTLITLLTAGALLAGGVLAGIFALGLLTIAESLLGFVTEFRLLELSNPASPLLERLLIEAPGTYQHSLTIANLVEPAVARIGGNALLARVGSLYHDVGKLRRPQFFVENQFSGHNPHDNLSPHLSYLIITSHVRDGIKLLHEYKLPDILDPFVKEHHGTTILAYFYKRALEENSDVEEFSFRYAGPRPQSKETAVLMIADAVESASRTLTDPSQSSVRALIDRIIEQRSQDDQFSESPLNLYDLEEIANSFERSLMAILHRRIRYPSDDEVKNLKNTQADTSLARIAVNQGTSIDRISLKSTLTPSHLPIIATMPNSKQSPSASDIASMEDMPLARTNSKNTAGNSAANLEDDIIIVQDDD